MSAVLQGLERLGRWFEDLLLSGLLLAMMGLACWQILGRNGIGQALTSGDELLRMMVLWLTLAAAMAASRADKHIAIPLLDRFLHGWQRRLARLISQLFTAGVCAILAWYSWQFVMTSREFEDTLLNGTPAWWLQLPMPVGFAIMSYRRALRGMALLWRKGSMAPEATS